MDRGGENSVGNHSRTQELMNIILAERFRDLDKDYSACVELLEISQRENDIYGIAFAYAYMGDCLIGKNESVNASGSLMRAKELCEKHRFLELLPYVCTWLGIYYEMQSDRQMAMHYFLDALEFAERNGDLLRQSILLNNIASQFQSCGNYEVAKEYYIKALKLFRQLENYDSSDPHYVQMTANIISSCCRLKQIDEAKYYLSILEQEKQLERNRNQLFLCQLLISASTGDISSTCESVAQLLSEVQEQPKDIHQLFETLLVVADSMVALEEKEYARKMLITLEGLCQKDEYGHKLKVQYIWVRYYKVYGTQEEKNKGYERFFELRQLSDTILNQNLSEGLLSKIKLKESVKKNQEIERQKTLLEGEIQLDDLTQLYNRRSFGRLTQEIISDSQTYSISFIMIDVDFFKQYNDTYGHAKGDEALRTVAQSLVSVSDQDVFNFRYGGDEFVSLCRNKTADEVEGYIQALCEDLGNKKIPHIGSLCSRQLTLSIGYSFHERGAAGFSTVSEMMTEADKALYWSKAQGRNCHYRYSDHMNGA